MLNNRNICSNNPSLDKSNLKENDVTYAQQTSYEKKRTDLEENSKQMNYLQGSSLFFDKRSKEYSINILTKIKYYTSRPSTLILENLDIVYGALYDLFNQRFAQDKGDRYCNIVYEDFKESLLIHEHFKCVIFKNETDFDVNEKYIENKLPSPLMNRFEKYLFNIEDLNDKGRKGIECLIKQIRRSMTMNCSKRRGSFWEISKRQQGEALGIV